MNRSDMFCKDCGQMTKDGKKRDRENYRTRAIWGTDFNKPLSQLIEDIRREITHVRGRLTDITHGYDCSDLYQSIKDVEGLMTCALVTLHHTMEERKKHEVMMEEFKNKNSKKG